HEVLEIAETEVIGTGRRHADLDRVLDIVDDVWEKADFGTPDLDDAWKSKAVVMLEKLYENWPGRGEPVEVELSVESEIEGVRWVGRVDRLERSDEGLRVVDYKTGTRAMTQDAAAVSIQLAFYALAVAKSRGDVVASEMWFPRTNTKSVSTRKAAMHRLDEIGQTMGEITRSISAEKWEPRVSEECKRCDFRRSCPAWPEGKGAFLP
ncbi:MAG TPA: PD-(D/E)XK nuclease family protein, partial [Acidimicrobiia bacterium]